MATGMRGHVGYAKETTWGTAVAATDYAEAFSESLALAIDRFEVKNIIGTIAEPDDMAGLTRAEGDLVVPGYPTILGFLAKGILPTQSGSIVLSGFLWTTTWTQGTTDFSTDVPTQPYTVEIFRDVTSSHRYSGAIVSRLGLEVQPNQDLRLTAGLIAKSTSIIAKTTPTFPTSPTFPFAFDTASITLAGTATALIERFTLTIDSQLEGVATLNNTTTVAKIRRRSAQSVAISGVMDFNDLTEYNNFVSQSEQALTLNLFRASSFNCTITVPRFVYTAYPATTPGRERLTVSFDGKARYHSGSGTALAIALTTTKSNF